MRTKLTLAALLAASPAQAAETDFRSLSDSERTLLAQEIRQVLLDNPALVLPAFDTPAPVPPAAIGYQDDIDADRALLDTLSGDIFATPIAGPQDAPRLAILTAPGCSACDAMQATLTDWAAQGRLRLFTLPLGSLPARQLGLDTAPSYIFERMIVRGDVPAVVLEKYLRKQGG